MELGSLGGWWHGKEGSRAGGKGPLRERHRSLNRTAEELMHRSGEGQGSSAHAPPTSVPLGPNCRRSSFPGQAGGGWRGLRGGPSATLPPAPLSCSAGWCVQVAGAEEGHSRSLGPGRSDRAAGAGFGGGGEAAPAPHPLYMGGSLQRTISRSLR